MSNGVFHGDAPRVKLDIEAFAATAPSVNIVAKRVEATAREHFKRALTNADQGTIERSGEMAAGGLAFRLKMLFISHEITSSIRELPPAIRGRASNVSPKPGLP
jgi:hypothetical protein